MVFVLYSNCDIAKIRWHGYFGIDNFPERKVSENINMIFVIGFQAVTFVFATRQFKASLGLNNGTTTNPRQTSPISMEIFDLLCKLHQF